MKYATNPTTKQPIDSYRTSGKIGEDHPNAKLTAKQVLEIRSLISQGIPISALTERFGVSKSTISSIRKGKTWKDITSPVQSSGVEEVKMVVSQVPL